MMYGISRPCVWIEGYRSPPSSVVPVHRSDLSDWPTKYDFSNDPDSLQCLIHLSISLFTQYSGMFPGWQEAPDGWQSILNVEHISRFTSWNEVTVFDAKRHSSGSGQSPTIKFLSSEIKKWKENSIRDVWMKITVWVIKGTLNPY